MVNYVGLSGTLHGLFAFYALKEALGGRKSSWLLVIGVMLKVASEQLCRNEKTSILKEVKTSYI